METFFKSVGHSFDFSSTEFALPETWKLPAGALVDASAAATMRTVLLLYWKVVMQPESIVHQMEAGNFPDGSIFLIHGELSVPFYSACVLSPEACPTITPDINLFVYITPGSASHLPCLRSLLPAGAFALQGVPWEELTLGRNQTEMRRLFGPRQLISLAGRAFHCGSFGAGFLSCLLAKPI